MYTLVDVLHGLAVVAATHAASTTFCCASDAVVFFSCSTTGHPVHSIIDNLHRMQYSCYLSLVQTSGFVFAVGAFRGFAKGALPGGLVAVS
jgi:hypothetical protein